MKQPLFTLVETRFGYGFLFGTLENPTTAEDVQRMCDTLEIPYSHISDEFSDIDFDDMIMGAVYIPAENDLWWFDLSDGTVSKATELK